MTVVDVLKAARGHLLDGWVGPEASVFCWGGGLSGQGAPVSWRDEGIEKFSVHGAICYAAAGAEDLVLGAWDELERHVSPVWRAQRLEPMPRRDAAPATWQSYMSLQLQPAGPLDFEWFDQPGRTLLEVSRAFEKAIISAKGRTTNGR